MSRPLKALIIEDFEDDVLLIVRQLSRGGFDVDYEHIETGEEMREALRQRTWDVVLSDHNLPQFSSIDALRILKESGLDLPFIILSASIGEETAVAAMRAGAHDFLMKGDLARLVPVIEREMQEARVRAERRQARFDLEDRNIELEQVNLRLRRIIDANKRLAFCPTVEELGKSLLMEFAHAMNAEGGSLYFKQGDQLVLVESKDPGHSPCSLGLPLKKESIFGRVWASKAPILIADVRDEIDLHSNGWGGYKNGSLLTMPLMDIDGDILGIISLHDKLYPPFTQQDRDLGLILASQSSETIKVITANEALRVSEERYRTYVECAPDAIFVINDSGEYLEVNEAACRITGYTEDEFRSLSIRDLFPDTIIEEVERDFEKLKREGYLSRESANLSKNGEEIILDIEAVSLEDGLYLIYCKDITRRKKAESERGHLEDQLLHSQKMEAVGQLAGGVAHDFNNLLLAITGHTDLAMEDLEPDSTSYDNLLQVQKATSRAATMTRQLLAFSRRQVLQPISVDLNKIISDLVKMLGRLIGEHIEIIIKDDPELWRVHADPGQLEQVIMNLCVNARDSMTEGGMLMIETSNVEQADLPSDVAAKYNGRMIKLKVSDTGCGMTPETLSHIFEPFFTTKEIGKGTGLGLATVYGVVRQHQGWIEADSVLGEGTSFTVHIPALETFARTMSSEHPTLTFGGPETVLLAEDEESVRELGRRVLEKAGYKVLAAENGEEALAIFQEKVDEISLVFIDIVMPKMGGVAASEAMRLKKAGLPILLTSGYRHDVVVPSERFDEGFQFLSKPYSPQDLLRRVRNILDAVKTE